MATAVALIRGIDRRQVMFLMVTALIAVGILAFEEIAEELQTGDMLQFDRAILLWFRVEGNLSQLRGPEGMLSSVRDITALGGGAVLTILILLTAGYLLLERRYGSAVLLIVAAAGGVVAMTLLKGLFSRVRPDMVPHLMTETSFSFPSGHSTMAAVVYLTMGSILAASRHRYRVKIYLFAVSLFLAVIVGISRVALGVHYPTDVLAGWCLGLAWASFCWFVALLLKYRSRLFRIAEKADTDGETGRREDTLPEVRREG